MAIIEIDDLFKAPEDKARLLYSDKEIIKKYWTVKPGDVCFDIGYGPGTWTLYSLAQGARTYSFDPKPVCFKILNELMLLNGFSGNVYTYGLWKERGKLILGENSSFKNPSDQALGEFFVTTLDEFCRGAPETGNTKIDRLDFINMDVEAAELEVIQGGRDSIRKFAPTIIVEIHGGVAVQDVKKELSNLHNYKYISDSGFLIAKP